MENFENVKIPYPTEGIIRTAQLDDTVTPENSVQLAVNMNFDRIGAIQSRPGVTQFATQLDGEVENFGTLNNFTVPGGYSRIIPLASPVIFQDTLGEDISSARLNSNTTLTFWSGSSNDGYVQIMKFDATTGLMTPSGTPLEFDTVDGRDNCCIPIALVTSSNNYVLNLWSRNGIGYAQIFNANIDTNTVTAVGSPFQFDASNAQDITVAMVDSSHVIVFYNGASNIGTCCILAINLGTWAVTKPASNFTFDSGIGFNNSCQSLGDGVHFINFWNNGNGQVQCFTVNTGTWAITANGTKFQFDTFGAYITTASFNDGQHFICFWSGLNSDGYVQAFNVAAGTYAVTALSTALEFDTVNAIYQGCVAVGDGRHFINMWCHSVSGPDTGYVQIFEADLSTFEITAVGIPLSVGVPYIAMNPSLVMLSSYRMAGFWIADPHEATGQAFRLDGTPVFNDYLYAQENLDEVKRWNGASWTTVRSGLSGGKARFAQFLNYLWMVNGNESIGDPVQTSNGGTFGTDLVPTGFPPGDFISAGFEGRVWVIDKLYGIIYYTDIVQFTPPDTYVLTYDPDVNFIKNLSPQDGQTFTGLVQVPRALLAFRENSIFRIYGATSVDAYPAYNVGTYSQESIVTTKTGIFFHHSSGIYQFDYGGQPVEISRRIIDFIRAIPRSSYENITGVYDGFDAVEWAVGTVTVEGVTFTNCMLRFTISTQVWTVYDYVGNVITAMISYDNGTVLNHLMGTVVGKVGALDTGTTDFGEAYYFEYIDRWRSFTEMYSKIKSISGFNVYSENAGGTNLMYQIQKSGPNVWKTIGTVNEDNNSLFPNSSTDDFDVIRLRMAGTTNGTPVVIHGIEILSITDKGFNEN